MMRWLLAINALLLAATAGTAASAADHVALRPVPMAAMPARGDDQPSTPLTLDEVLRSSARAAPDIVAALARVRQAEGRAPSAEGAFDTVFSVDARSRLAGYYDGSEVTGKAERPSPATADTSTASIAIRAAISRSMRTRPIPTSSAR
jgi:hypothetical protein